MKELAQPCDLLDPDLDLPPPFPIGETTKVEVPLSNVDIFTEMTSVHPRSASLPQKFKFSGLKWRTPMNPSEASEFHETIMGSICRASVEQIQKLEDNPSKVALQLLEISTFLPRDKISVELLHFIYFDIPLDSKALTCFNEKVGSSIIFQACQILEKSSLISMIQEKSTIGSTHLCLYAVRVHRHVEKWVRRNLSTTQSRLDCLGKLAGYFKHNIEFFCGRGKSTDLDDWDKSMVQCIQTQIKENHWSGKTYRHAIYFSYYLNTGEDAYEKIYNFFVANPKRQADEPYFELCKMYLVFEHQKKFEEFRGKQLCNVILDNSQFFDEVNPLRLVRLDDFIHWACEVGIKFKENLLVRKTMDLLIRSVLVDGGKNLNLETKYRIIEWKRSLLPDTLKGADMAYIHRISGILLHRAEWMALFIRRMESRLTFVEATTSFVLNAPVRRLEGWPKDIWKVGSFPCAQKEAAALEVTELFLANGGVDFLKRGLIKVQQNRMKGIKLVHHENFYFAVLMDLTYFSTCAARLLHSVDFVTGLKDTLSFLLTKQTQNSDVLHVIMTCCLSFFARKENGDHLTRISSWNEMKLAFQYYRKLEVGMCPMSSMGDVEIKILKGFLASHDELSAGILHKISTQMAGLGNEEKTSPCSIS